MHALAAADLGPKYDAAARRWHDQLLARGFGSAYRSLMPRRAIGAALDVGCGSGAMSMALLSQTRPRTMDLMDPSAAMLRSATTRVRAAGLQGRDMQASVGDQLGQGYDLVLCAHVLEHLEDPMAGLTWIRNRLAPGGQAILAVSRPHFCTSIIRLRWGHQAWAPDIFVEMLVAAGFSAIDVKPFETGIPSRISCGYIATAP